MQPCASQPVHRPHRPLSGKGNIRLLTIHPGQWSEEMRCTLSHHVLGEEMRLQYSALSYAWGSPKVTDKILLNGEPWDVTVNLSHALYFLRETDTPVRIWIDALVRKLPGWRPCI